MESNTRTRTDSEYYSELLHFHQQIYHKKYTPAQAEREINRLEKVYGRKLRHYAFQPRPKEQWTQAYLDSLHEQAVAAANSREFFLHMAEVATCLKRRHFAKIAVCIGGGVVLLTLLAALIVCLVKIIGTEPGTEMTVQTHRQEERG